MLCTAGSEFKGVLGVMPTWGRAREETLTEAEHASVLGKRHLRSLSRLRVHVFFRAST